ncbi:UNKNOWN [Stylonychia lemnae]|uniref:Uncharacterized protein n=1 Tax=Stylonychia lemnae TaxID=5949 RepID=A0A077ZWK8_STYLE|nr:UNKNOWN [Stylonychia lemnae]|eukprot:CDW74254.1 UNKNOWN [Stylonychia lemnae]
MSETKAFKLNLFLDCFNSIAEEQISQDSSSKAEFKQTKDKSIRKQSSSLSQSQPKPKKNHVSNVFSDIPLMLNALMDYIDENGLNDYGGSSSNKKQAQGAGNETDQTSRTVKENILKSIQIVFHDYQQPEDQDILIVLYKSIVRNIQTMRDDSTVKIVLNLVINELRAYDYRFEFFKCKGLQQMVNLIASQGQISDSSKSLIMKFIRKLLLRSDRASEIDQLTEGSKSIRGSDIRSIFQTITNDIAEYFTNPDYIFHDKAFDDQQQSPNTTSIDLITDQSQQKFRLSQGSVLKKFATEDEDSQMMYQRFSDSNRNSALNAYPPTKNLLEGLMLQQEFSANRPSSMSQRSSRVDQLNEYDRLSIQLREDKFIETLLDALQSSTDQDLPSLMEIYSLLIIYSLYNERDFERQGGYSKLQARLLKCQDIKDKKKSMTGSIDQFRVIDAIFEQLFQIICPQKLRIKTYNCLKLLLNLVEQCDNNLIQIQALTTLKIILEKELENCVIFYKASGYKYLENAITVISLIHKNSKLHILKQIIGIAQYVIYVLGDLDVLPMIEFASGFIQSEKVTLTNEIYEELSNFISTVVDDKSFRLRGKRTRDAVFQNENINCINIMGTVFMNGYSLLKQSIDILKTKDRQQMTFHDHFFFDQSIKLLIKIAEYQIKVQSKQSFDSYKIIIRDSDSKTVIDKLLESTDNLDTFIGKLLNLGLNDNLKYLKILNLISQLLIIQQPLYQNSDVQILRILDQINASSQSQFYQVFLTFLFSDKRNPFVKKLVENIELNNGLIQKLQDQLIAYLPKDNMAEKLLKDLHFLTLLCRYSGQNQETFDKNLDIFVFLKSLNLNHYDIDQQLLIMQFLLELQGRCPLYEYAIDKTELYIEANINQILSHQYVEFVNEMRSELKSLSNIFNNNLNDLSKSDSKQEGLQNIKRGAQLRGCNESITMFLVTLVQAKPKVQISIFQDLISLMNGQPTNRKIINEMESLEFFLKIFSISRENQKTSEHQAYSKTLSDFIYQLLLNIQLQDPGVLLNSLLDKSGLINSYHLQNVINALAEETPSQFIQIQTEDQQNLEDNIELFPDQVFDKMLVFNGWVQLGNTKPNQNLIFQVRDSKYFIKFIYEYNVHSLSSNDGSANMSSSDNSDYLIILMNDFYKRLPIDSRNDQAFFKVHEYNNFHIQISQKMGLINQIDNILIMINGVNITDLIQSKVKFDGSPLKLLLPQQQLNMTNLSAFDRLLIEQEVSVIYNQGLIDADPKSVKPTILLPESNYKPPRTSNIPQYQKVTKIKLNPGAQNKGWNLRLVIPLNYENLDVHLIEDKMSQMIYQEYTTIPGTLIFKVQPLKQYLCNEQALRAALNLIEVATDEKQLSQAFDFLSTLVIRNDRSIVQILHKINGFETLRDLILQQQSEKLNTKVTLQSLIDMSCNSYEVDMFLQKQPLNMQQHLRLNVKFDESRMEFLKVALRLLPQVKDSNMLLIVNSIYQLILKSDDNAKTFRNQIGVSTVLRLFQLVGSDTKFLVIYDTILQIYEHIVVCIKEDVFEDGIEDLRLIFDFFGHQNFKNQKICVLAMDSLSIIAIHIVAEDQINDKSLLQKVLKLDLQNKLFGLMKADNVEVKEYAIKFLSLILLRSAEFKKQYKGSLGFKYMTECLNQNAMTSRNLIKSIIEATADQFDNPNALYPSTSSIIHQLMNDSQIASKIVDMINMTLHKPKKSLIKHFELFQSIFSNVTYLESEQSSSIILKEVRSLIKESNQCDQDGNTNVVNLQREHFTEFLDYIFEFLNLMEYRLEQVNQSLIYSGENQNSATDDSNSKNNQSNEKQIQQSEQSQTLAYIKDQTDPDDFKQLLILARILKYFESNPKIQNKEYHTLFNIKQVNIISFHGMLQIIIELDQIIDDNVYVNLKLMQLINSFAFKNTMDIRKHMKNLQLFEIRDDLMIDIIRHCAHCKINEEPPKYESPKKQQSKFNLISTSNTSANYTTGQQTEHLLKLVSSFSFETVASKSKFRELKCIESIAYFMINSQLQTTRDQFRAIVKDQIMQYEENLAYIKQELSDLSTLVQFKEYGEGQMKSFVSLLSQRVQEDSYNRSEVKKVKQEAQLTRKLKLIDTKHAQRTKQEEMLKQLKDKQLEYLDGARQNLKQNKITQVISGALNYGIVIV